MKSIDALVKKALEFKEKGLSDKEIGDELHLSPETVTWLLTRGMRGEAPPKDVKIGPSRHTSCPSIAHASHIPIPHFM